MVGSSPNTNKGETNCFSFLTDYERIMEFARGVGVREYKPPLQKGGLGDR